MISERRRHARALFAPLGPTYDRVGAALSFGQDPRWRRFLVSRLPQDGGEVLDVATGTGLVAKALARAGIPGHRRRPEPRDAGSRASALRRPGRARRSIRRRASVRRPVVRPPDVHVSPPLRRRPGRHPPGARPGRSARRNRRDARVRAAARCLAAAVGPVGRGRASARGQAPLPGLARGRPVPRPLDPAVPRRAPGAAAGRSLARGGDRGRAACAARASAAGSSSGGGGMRASDRSIPASRPAFYALRPGGWRDYVTLLHLPYTAWHLSYVVVGGCLAAEVDWWTLGLTVLAFALAMGVGAHALDELDGRPLRTEIPSPALVALAVGSVAAASAIGVAVALERTLWILPLVAVGVVLVPRLQPRAPRREGAHRPRLRALVGGVPGPHGVRGADGDVSRRGAPRGGVGDGSLAGAATALPGGPPTAPRHGEGRRPPRRRGR